MITTSGLKSTTLSCSKINYKSAILHPLARFVAEDAVALMFNITPDQIYRIDCYRYVVYVHAKGISRFVSYADFPPILGSASPNTQDFLRWHKRWRDRQHSQFAPKFWQQFYSHQFKQAHSVEHLRDWGLLVGKVKSEFTEFALQQLREIYTHEKYCRECF